MARLPKLGPSAVVRQPGAALVEALELTAVVELEDAKRRSRYGLVARTLAAETATEPL
jgi:hypothetical protein